MTSSPKIIGREYARVRRTRDYDSFEFIKGNRNVKPHNVQRLIKAIKANNLLLDYPILVRWNPKTGKYTILDGQHRFSAAMELCVEFAFMTSYSNGTRTVDDIAGANTAQTRWSQHDIMHSNTERGKEDYIELQRFSEAHELPLQAAAGLLMTGEAVTGGSAIRDALWDGTFSIETQDQAEAVVQLVEACDKAGVVVARHGLFVRALSRCMSVDGFDSDWFKRKLRYNAKAIRPSRTVTEYIDEIETFYNDRLRERPALMFKSVLAERVRLERLANLDKARSAK